MLTEAFVAKLSVREDDYRIRIGNEQRREGARLLAARAIRSDYADQMARIAWPHTRTFIADAAEDAIDLQDLQLPEIYDEVIGRVSQAARRLTGLANIDEKTLQDYFIIARAKQKEKQQSVSSVSLSVNGSNNFVQYSGAGHPRAVVWRSFTKIKTLATEKPLLTLITLAVTILGGIASVIEMVKYFQY